MPTVFTTEELTAGRVVGLLTVEYAGATWRWSTREVEVETEDGQALAYLGGLGEVELDEELDLFGDSPAVLSMPCEVFWPEDVARLVALGHDLGAATGEFALLREGDAWENRVVLVSGRVVEPEYGDTGEPVTFSLEREPDEDGGAIPEPEAAVKNGVTWAASASGVEGAPYPFVFGQPGPFVTADGTADDGSASPAYVLSSTGPSRYVIVAGHATETGYNGDTVDIYNEDLADRETGCVCSHDRDLRGRLVTVAAVPTVWTAATPWKTDHKLWTVWTDSRGALCTSRDAAIAGAGDLLVALLERSTVEVDRGALASAAAYLNRFLVSGYIDDGSPPSAWIRDNLTPILPVSLANGPRGLYPVVWRYDATAADAVDELVVGRGLIRTKPVAYTEPEGGIVNEITLSYALRARLDEYARSRTITGDPTKLGEPDVLTSMQARQSWSRWGGRSDALETDIVYDTATADLILLTQILRRGFQRREVELQADYRYDWLRRGELVLLTDADVHMRRQLGIVTNLGRGIGSRLVRVTVLEEPARDARHGQVTA